MSQSSRQFQSRVPVKVIAGAILIVLLLGGFILFAVWESNKSIVQARMTGTVVAKEFQPAGQQTTEITLNRQGTLTSGKNEGEFVITVDVPQTSGPPRRFTVWLNDRARFEAVKVGDQFDVGPYLVPSR